MKLLHYLPTHRYDFNKNPSLADIVNRLTISLKRNEDHVLIDVRHSHVIKDAMKESKKAKFDATKLLKVCGAYYHIPITIIHLR